MDELKKELTELINRMGQHLDSDNYRVEADRFSDIASDAELIAETINQCKTINWDE